MQGFLIYRDENTLREKGIECYKNFIRGMLDVTDNIVDGEIIPPKNVIRYDEDDPYLVVAADKGTASFSDYANQIASEYNFWLCRTKKIIAKQPVNKLLISNTKIYPMETYSIQNILHYKIVFYHPFILL